MNSKRNFQILAFEWKSRFVLITEVWQRHDEATLTSPDIHFHVVLSELVEVSFVDDEKASRDHGRFNGRRWILLSHLALSRRQVFPLKDEIPVKSSPQV